MPTPGRHTAYWPPNHRHANLIPSVSREDQRAGILSGRRIVLVDDNPDLVIVCARLLRAHGADVLGTCSHHEAFSMLWDEAADAIVSNLGEEGEGFELISRIRSSDDPQVANVPAIALSGFDHAEVIERAFVRGYDLFLPKPVELTELVGALGSVMHPREAPDRLA